MTDMCSKDQRTCPACIGTNGNHEGGCYLAPPSSKERSFPLFSPTKAARDWARRRGRPNDAMLIEAWTTGWNARCIPEEPGALADHLRSMLLDGTVQCPLCGKTGPHPHSPEEIVIYRNGVKYGRSLKVTPVDRDEVLKLEQFPS